MEPLNGRHRIPFRIKENSLLAKIAAWKLNSRKAAIVFGDTIHLCRTSKDEFLGDPRWLKHELKHIEQFRQYGSARFIFLYLTEWVKKGYWNNRFEIEARAAEQL
jgi:hypothetical protein